MMSQKIIDCGVNPLNQNAGKEKERSDYYSFEAEPNRLLEPVGY
jgi:hypothetical protein